MNHIYKGAKIKAINSAPSNIEMNKYYIIKELRYSRYIYPDNTTKLVGIIVDLDHLKNYNFVLSTFEHYFGKYTLRPNNINKNIKIL
jgi:hypothetical protein